MHGFATPIRLLPVGHHPSIIGAMPYALDIVVLLAYFALVLGIGFAQRSKSGSMEGFALGDRQIAWWAVLASILAAEISAGTFFGAPGEGFALRNYTYIQLIIGYLLARVVVSAVFIPATTTTMSSVFMSFSARASASGRGGFPAACS
jgi:Na+/proline symporter